MDLKMIVEGSDRSYVHNKRRKHPDELSVTLWWFYKLVINLKSVLKETGSQLDKMGVTLMCLCVS